ncbi:MAG: GumC family protein [bacterium]
MAQYELNLKDYWFIVRKRKMLIILVALLIGIFSFIFAYINKPIPIFEATTQVKIERNTTFAGLMLEVIRWTSWNDMETNARIVKSFSLVEKVAKKLGYVDPNIDTLEILNNENVIQKINDIQSKTTASQISSSNILEIRVTSDDPREAQTLANTITETFRQENIGLNNRRIIEAKMLIENLLRKQNDRLVIAEEDLKVFRRNESLFGVNQTTDYASDKFLDARKNIEEIQKQKRTTAWMINELSQRNASVYEVFNTIFLTPDMQKFYEDMRELVTVKEALLLDYTEEHPAVRKVQRQIDGIRAEILTHLVSKNENLHKEEGLARNMLALTEEEAKKALEYEIEFNRLDREIKLNERLVTFLKEKYQEALIRESGPIEEIYIIKPALLPKKPINPHSSAKPTMIGTIIGLIIGMVASFLAESLDPSIGTIEEVESYLGVPALGIIHYATMDNIEKYMRKHAIRLENEKVLKHIIYLMTLCMPKYVTSEMYRTLRTTLQFAAEDKKAKAFLVTSAVDGEGKTAVSVNLAFTLAQIGKKTLLIGGDFRKPQLHKIFGIDREPGLADVLLGNCKWESVVRDAADILLGTLSIKNAISSPGLDNLHIMTCGIQTIQSVEILQSNTMNNLLEQLKKQYDYIIIDSTPIVPVSDAIVLSAKMDGTIIVYRVGKVSQMLLKRAKLQLDTVKANVLGIIFNGLKQDTLKEIYSSGYKIYQYYDEHK